jgi:Uma2 family endonuclease
MIAVRPVCFCIMQKRKIYKLQGLPPLYKPLDSIGIAFLHTIEPHKSCYNDGQVMKGKPMEAIAPPQIVEHPTPDDILLVVEASRSSLQYDRREKVNIYTADMIPEVWIIDIQNRIAYQYLQPGKGKYAVVNTFTDTEQITSPALDGKQIAVADLLGSK